LKIILSIIFTEAITELAVKSELFFTFRQFLFESKSKILNFIHKIFDCGYCFSVWAALISFLLVFIINNKIIDYFVLIIIVHRLSNLFHFLLDRINGNKV